MVVRLPSEDSLRRRLNPIPSSPNTLNRALGEYCAPKTPAPPVLLLVLFTSGSVPGVPDEIRRVVVLRE